MTVDQVWDSASRMRSEASQGKTVSYGFDKVHNRVKTIYPSGHVVDVAVDLLDRPDTVTVAGQATPAVDYGYRGPWLRSSVAYGNGLSGTSSFDHTWRPTKTRVALPSSIHTTFEETLAWNPRSLKTAIGRADADGRGFILAHDGSHRLTAAVVSGVVPLTFTLGNDGHTLRSDAALPAGSSQLDIDSTSAVDLDGKGLVSTFQQSFEVAQASEIAIPFEQPDPTVVPVVAFVNRFGFHGRPVDLETGYTFQRNRHYDPQTERFISADPMGYRDGPSQYQGFGSSPLNYGDSLGLAPLAPGLGSGISRRQEEAGVERYPQNQGPGELEG